MPLLESLKKNSGVYLLHILSIIIVAPSATGSIVGFLEIIFESNSQGFPDGFIKIIGGAILYPLYGSIFSIPLSVISLLVFKFLMDWNKDNRINFCSIGVLSGGLVYSVYIYLGESNLSVFLTLLFVGIATGYFLSFVWKDDYTKTKSVTT